MGLIDTHCHFDMLEDPRPSVAEARAAGVDAVVAIGIDLASSSRSAVALAERTDGVYATVGLHPHDAVHFDDVVPRGLRRSAAHPSVVAVGECGLDFYRDHSPRDAAAAGFRRADRAGARAGKPLVVHIREAGGETFALLTEHAAGLTVVLHCFSPPESVDQCNERGYYLSLRRQHHVQERRRPARGRRARARGPAAGRDRRARSSRRCPNRGNEQRARLGGAHGGLGRPLRAAGAPDALAAVTTANARRAFGLPAGLVTVGRGGRRARPASGRAGRAGPARRTAARRRRAGRGRRSHSATARTISSTRGTCGPSSALAGGAARRRGPRGRRRRRPAHAAAAASARARCTPSRSTGASRRGSTRLARSTRPARALRRCAEDRPRRARSGADGPRRQPARTTSPSR